MNANTRNILIVVAIAAGIAALQTTGFAVAGLVLRILSILIVVGLCYFGYVLWRENRHQVNWLPAQKKYALYGAAAVLVLTVISSSFWVTNGLSSLLFFAILGGCGYVIYRIWSDARRYY